MTFTTEQVNYAGAHQQGQIAVEYNSLVETFGYPNVVGPTFEPSDNKVTCMWAIQFDDGMVVTIYDWDTITTPMHLHSWIVGGYDQQVVDRVLSTIGGHESMDRVKSNNDKLISIVEIGLSKLKESKTPLETADCLNSLGDILKYQARKLLV